MTIIKRAFAIKAMVGSHPWVGLRFDRQRTMYRGRSIAVGDEIYLFDSENSGGRGLCAKGVATAVEAVTGLPGRMRQTPLVTVEVRFVSSSHASLGRKELRGFTDWGDTRPEVELNFKFYRQATDKVAQLTPEAAAFLDTFFDPPQSSFTRF